MRIHCFLCPLLNGARACTVQLLRKRIRAMPFFHSSILPFFHSSILLSFHPSILLSFHPSILPSSNRVNSVRARVAALVSFVLDRFYGRIKDRIYFFSSCSDSRLKLYRYKLIKLYFYEGYEYSLIVCFLYFVHGISTSIRQLKGVLKSNHLRRKIPPIAVHNITVISLVMLGNNMPLGIYNTHLNKSK